MRLLVLSDLHVWGPEDPLYRSLLRLLREEARPGDTWVFAGDLFDLFIGNKPTFVTRYRDFIEAIRAAGGRGVRMHYIEGNHDFHIRKAFAGIPGLQIHSHDFEIKLEGKRFFFAHGDTVDRSDYGYRMLRLFLRSPIMKSFVRVAPGKLIDRIGKKSSERSRATKPRLPRELPIERMEKLRRAYRNFACERLTEGFDFVVLGHCHDLDEMRFQIGERTGQYINVGYPRVHGSFLSWTPADAEIHRVPIERS